MASSKDYMDFILEQLSELDEITYRARVYSKRQIRICRDCYLLIKRAKGGDDYGIKQRIP